MRRGCGQRAQIVQLTQVPDQADQLRRLLLGARAGERQQASKLVFQLGTTQGIARITFGLVDAPVPGLPRNRGHLHAPQPTLRIGAVDLLIQHHAHLVAEVGHTRIGERMLMKFG